MVTHPRRRLLLVLALLCTACRAGEETSNLLLEAPDRARESGSASIEVVTRMVISQVGGDLNITSRSHGVIDFSAARARMTIDSRQEGTSALTLKPCELVTDGAVAFLSIPDAQQQQYEGKAWLELDMARDTGIDPNLFSTDPTASLEYMRGAPDEVEEVGTDDVRGAPTTHYRFRVATEDLLERVEADRRDPLRAHLEQLGVTEIPYEAWLDRSGRPRKTSFQMKAGDGLFDMTTTTELYEYGKAVEIRRPPRDEVAPAPGQQVAYAVCFDQASPAPGRPASGG